MGVTHPHRIHGIGIFTYGFHVGQYPIPMDPMGSVPGSSILQATRGSLVFRASNWTLRSSFSWKFFSRRDGWIPMKKSQEMRRDVYVCIYININIVYVYIYIHFVIWNTWNDLLMFVAYCTFKKNSKISKGWTLKWVPGPVCTSWRCDHDGARCELLLHSAVATWESPILEKFTCCTGLEMVRCTVCIYTDV